MEKRVRKHYDAQIGQSPEGQEQTHLLAFYHTELSTQIGMQSYSIIFSTPMNSHNSEMQMQRRPNERKRLISRVRENIKVLLFHARSVCRVKVIFHLSDRCVCVCMYVTGDPLCRANLCFFLIMCISHSEM